MIEFRSVKPSRREICRAGALGAMAAGLGACDLGSTTPGASAAGGHAVPDSVLASAAYALTMASFLPHVGSRFHLAGGGGARAELTLVRVTDLGAGARTQAGHGECFALSFDAAAGSDADAGAGSALDQDTYTASHAALGAFPLFVVPGRSDSGAVYSAVFNRV
jgi:hypothetical protein